jgi:hypothetical protein
MVLDIVRNIIARHEDLVLAGEVAGHDGLLPAARAAKADVLLLVEPASGEACTYEPLLYGRPCLKVLAITADGREGFLHKLRPEVIPLGELSPDVIVEAIRGASRAESGGAGHG